ncbi:MAG TPA: winged helix-turn-helix domain-containing protein [Streptomyces sp.]|nr:winged helix-turn-helix domain-containing protein [Streptomyces sp.]HET6353605.1 winged helix-turn-helix domain-containing protein [Streptomyces sp.]
MRKGWIDNTPGVFPRIFGVGETLAYGPCSPASGGVGRRHCRERTWPKTAAWPTGWAEDQCRTLARIAEVVRRRFGVNYTLAGLDLLVHRIGGACRSPPGRPPSVMRCGPCPGAARRGPARSGPTARRSSTGSTFNALHGDRRSGSGLSGSRTVNAAPAPGGLSAVTVPP